MPLIPIDNLDDPRVHVYRDLPRLERHLPEDLMIAEGQWVVERLLHSAFEVDSLLVTRAKAPLLAAQVDAALPVYVVSNELASQIVGVAFHLGVLACARRRPLADLDAFMQALPPVNPGVARLLVVCHDLTNPDNLGAIIRTAAALGADGVICDQQGADPFVRRAIRVSMGAVFHLPVLRTSDLASLIAELRERHGLRIAATTLDAQALELATYQPGIAVGHALVLGNEGYGLPENILAQADVRLTIAMQRDIDSLNVAATAAICLHHLHHTITTAP